MSASGPQSETIAFLSSPAAFGGGTDIEIVETHAAYVFLCGEVALKLKRAVTYDYMDLSTVERRRTMLQRELELNATVAPEIYRDVLPVTRGKDGLELGGDGPAVDWVLRMWRFPEENEFEAIAARDAFDDDLATTTGEAIAAYHAAAPVVGRPGGVLIEAILEELAGVFAGFEGAAGTERVDEWLAAAHEALDESRTLLDARGRDGHVRRGHGDLHLRNLVLIEGRPVPFDALEFDETLGTCDVLYDVAFLIMDLHRRGLERQACHVLNAWLREARGHEDAGLAVLPLFLSVRAAIRAMVLLQTDAARGQTAKSADVAAYLDLACTALQPSSPEALIAVGGLSASGKSELARALAPKFGPLPGAVLLVSDLERKAGQDKDKRLEGEAYTPARREAVYRAMFERAETILAAGYTAVLDATFIDAALRAAAAETAKRKGALFRGFWLDVPQDVLKKRLGGRSNGASDADLQVLRQQIETPLGAIDWVRLDGTADPTSLVAVVLDTLRAGANDAQQKTRGD